MNKQTVLEKLYFKKIFFQMFLIVFICLIPQLAIGLEKCQFDASVADTRPDPPGKTTTVSLDLFLFDLSNIDTLRQEFTLDFFLAVEWTDLRLGEILKKQGKKSCEANYNDIWRPKMFPVNSRVISTTLPEVFYVYDDGSVRSEQRIIGTFGSHLNLKDFPLDTQMLPVEFISTKYTPEEVTVVYQGGGFEKQFSLAGWNILALTAGSGKYTISFSGTKTKKHTENLAYFKFALKVQRQLDFYLWKVILPLFLMVLISWIVFWINPGEFAVQATISNGMLISIVAFLFSLQFLLPKIPYLTRMDLYVYTSLLFVFFALIETVITCTMAKNSKLAMAHKIDVAARLVFPISFIAICYWIWFL